MDLADYDEADAQFALPSTYFGQVGRFTCIHEAEAGRALVALQQGRLKNALTLIEPLLPHLPDTRDAPSDRPIALFLACYQVLDAVGDSRAAEVLKRGRRYLADMAAKIHDETMRRSFLEKVSYYRELLQLGTPD